jgi:hypothetical protein
VPLSFFGRDESPTDTIKLSRAEKQLKPIVASELPALFKAALALRRIRNARLFRTEAATFSGYLADRYALFQTAIRELFNSIATTEELVRDLALTPGLRFNPCRSISSVAKNLPRYYCTDPNASRCCRALSDPRGVHVLTGYHPAAADPTCLVLLTSLEA